MATMPKYDEIDERELKQREVDNLYICIVTRGCNKEAVYRSYNAMRHLEEIHPSVHVHVLTDEPYYYPDINCWSCPKAFTTGKAMYKARALEWYRRQLKLTENDWILHLDEESVIDAYGIRRCLEFIWYTSFEFGQGVIFYNQYRYWKNWLWTCADAIRVGDDLSRFQLQYSYFHRPIFGAHGSFLLTNGVVENSVTWDLASLTEDFEFAVNAWGKGYRCGQVPAIVREQSPQTFMDFMKQRRRFVFFEKLTGANTKQVVLRNHSSSLLFAKTLGFLLDPWYAVSLLYHYWNRARHHLSHGYTALDGCHQGLFVCRLCVQLRPRNLYPER
jgi:hypothetical protein